MTIVTAALATAVSPTTPLDSAVTTTEVVLPGIVDATGLQLQSHVLPLPTAGQALVRVEASGISFAEKSMLRGRYPGQPKFPFVPGYDLVGTVQSVGADVDPALIGQRVAALTQTGGWANHTLLTAADLIPVPESLDPAEVETLIVNGVTAYQMLYRSAHVQPGQTILVHGANGGVGTVLVQLALHHGVRVIGVASPRHHDALRALGVDPVDYADINELFAKVHTLAPNGVDAVFDNIGGETLKRSWRVLAPGGTLVSYAIASALQGTGSVVPSFVALLARLAWWNTLPNGRKAMLYDIWNRGLTGRTHNLAAFRSRLREDLTTLFGLLERGVLKPEVAARFPLTQIREAMELYESRTTRGKVVLIP